MLPSPGSKTPISLTHATEEVLLRYWMQLATENKGAGLFIVVIWCFVKCFILLFRACEVVLNPTNPYARRQPDTQIASRLERERERETVEASCFVQRGPPCCDNNDSKQHAAQRGPQKPSRHSQLFKYSGKTILLLSPAVSGANIKLFYFCSRSESRQS